MLFFRLLQQFHLVSVTKSIENKREIKLDEESSGDILKMTNVNNIKNLNFKP